ncbi:MAG: hypothetical protein ACP5M9_01090 [Candidatus Micrarchaeia archaeon]
MKNFKIISIIALVLFTLQISLAFSQIYGASISTSQQSSNQQYCSTPSGIVQQNAPWYCSEINQAMISYWDKWAPIALLALFVSFDSALLIYLLSVILSDEKIKNFAMSEFYEAIATGLIVIGFLSLAATIIGLGPSLIINTNPYTTSLSYISNTITTTQGTVSQLFNIAAKDSIYTSTKLEICASAFCFSNIIGVFSFSINYLFVIPSLTLITYLNDGLTLLYGEFYIILLFMYAAIPVFLIPGIILRAILPTRSVGGLMIAMAIGFYVIMPTLFSVAFYFTNTSLLNDLNYATNYLAANSAGGNAQINAASQNSPLVVELNLLEQGMGTFWLSVLFYPILIFGLTYAIIIQLANFIGGATQTSSRLKII